VGWFWGQVVLRVLSGTLSGTDIIYRLAANPITSVDGPQDIARIVSVSQTYSILATPELWIGVVLGAAMIGAAIYRRRATDEG
jgi:ABC-2 type transport system permease protein